MTRFLSAVIAMIAVSGCDQPTAAEDECEAFAIRTNATDFVNPRTGRLDRDPTTNEIIDPETGEVALSRSQEECLRRKAQEAIDRYESE